MNSFDDVVCALMKGNVLDDLNLFMDSQLDRFRISKGDQGAEYTSEQFQSYQQFCDILEDRINQSCSENAVEPQTFMLACRQNIESSPTVDTFAKILLISTEFQLFDDIMRDLNKRQYMFKIWRDWSDVLVRRLGRK